MIVRPETREDLSSIEQITIDAFKGKPYGDGTEHQIINRLREARALFLSLVAEINGQVVGHVAFSAVTINGGYKGWYGLGPVSVQPEFQKQGIGSKLIETGLSLIREMGARGCVLEGSPGYYQRFGFKPYSDLIYEDAPAPEYFMAYPFYDEMPRGKVRFHNAFYTTSH